MTVPLRLPQKNEIAVVDPSAEPTRYYYWPLVGWFYRRRLQMILEVLGETQYDSLLEVAYGSGIFLPSVAPLAKTLHGIDLHTKIDVVQQTLSKAGVKAELRTGDALAMPYADGSFDCVVNISMLEHLTDPGKAIEEMLRVLKPGGCLALGFPGRNAVMDAFFRVLGFSPRKIHPSSHEDILDAVGQRMTVAELSKLPMKVPNGFALYFCCRATK